MSDRQKIISSEAVEISGRNNGGPSSLQEGAEDREVQEIVQRGEYSRPDTMHRGEPHLRSAATSVVSIAALFLCIHALKRKNMKLKLCFYHHDFFTNWWFILLNTLRVYMSTFSENYDASLLLLGGQYPAWRSLNPGSWGRSCRLWGMSAQPRLPLYHRRTAHAQQSVVPGLRSSRAPPTFPQLVWSITCPECRYKPERGSQLSSTCQGATC